MSMAEWSCDEMTVKAVAAIYQLVVPDMARLRITPT